MTTGSMGAGSDQSQFAQVQRELEAVRNEAESIRVERDELKEQNDEVSSLYYHLFIVTFNVPCSTWTISHFYKIG